MREYNKPKYLSNIKLTPKSQKLRKEMTKEEKHLWYDFLRNLPIGFKRQKTIGNYIVDFYCSKAKLVIELDGSQHYENDAQIKSDIERDKYLSDLGLRVMRFSNYEIHKNFRGVCETIYNSLPLGEGGSP